MPPSGRLFDSAYEMLKPFMALTFTCRQIREETERLIYDRLLFGPDMLELPPVALSMFRYDWIVHGSGSLDLKYDYNLPGYFVEAQWQHSLSRVAVLPALSTLRLTYFFTIPYEPLRRSVELSSEGLKRQKMEECARLMPITREVAGLIPSGVTVKVAPVYYPQIILTHVRLSQSILQDAFDQERRKLKETVVCTSDV